MSDELINNNQSTTIGQVETITGDLMMINGVAERMFSPITEDTIKEQNTVIGTTATPTHGLRDDLDHHRTGASPISEKTVYVITDRKTEHSDRTSNDSDDSSIDSETAAKERAELMELRFQKASEALKEALKQAEQRVKELNEEVRTSESLQSDMQWKYEELQVQNQQWGNQISHLNAIVTAQEERIHWLTNEYEAAVLKIEKLKAALTRSYGHRNAGDEGETMEQLYAMISNLERQVVSADNANASLKCEVANQQALLEQLQKDNKKLRQNKEKNGEMNKHLNDTVVVQSEKLEELAALYQKAQEQIAALVTDIESPENKEEAITGLKRSLHGRNIQIVDLTNEHTRLGVENEQLARERASLRAELEKADAYIRRLENQKQRDAEQIAWLEKDKSDNEATLELIKAEHGVQLRALQTQVAQTATLPAARARRTAGKVPAAKYYRERRHQRMKYCLEDFKRCSLSGRRVTKRQPIRTPTPPGTRQPFVPAAVPVRTSQGRSVPAGRPSDTNASPRERISSASSTLSTLPTLPSGMSEPGRGRYRGKESFQYGVSAPHPKNRRRSKYPCSGKQREHHGMNRIRHQRTAEWVAANNRRRRSASDSERISHSHPAFGWSPSVAGKKNQSTQTKSYTPNVYPQPDMPVMLSAMCQLIQTTMKTFFEDLVRIFGGAMTRY